MADGDHSTWASWWRSLRWFDFVGHLAIPVALAANWEVESRLVSNVLLLGGGIIGFGLAPLMRRVEARRSQ